MPSKKIAIKIKKKKKAFSVDDSKYDKLKIMIMCGNKICITYYFSVINVTIMTDQQQKSCQNQLILINKGRPQWTFSLIAKYSYILIKCKLFLFCYI